MSETPRRNTTNIAQSCERERSTFFGRRCAAIEYSERGATPRESRQKPKNGHFHQFRCGAHAGATSGFARAVSKRNR